jgi:hypothetical protein
MAKINFLICFIFLEILAKKSFNNKFFSLLSSINEDNYTPTIFSYKNSNILWTSSEAIKKFFSPDLDSDKDEDTKLCWNTILTTLIGEYDYSILYFYSGHKLTEIGDENSCLDENNTYLLGLISYNINETSNKAEDKLAIFSSKDKSNIGICIWRECNNFIKKTLIDKIDEDLKKNLEKIYHINDLKVNWNYKELKDEKNKYSSNIKAFGIFLIIYFLIFILMKIFIVIIKKHKKMILSKESDGFFKEKKKKKDYLKMENVIKEEENEDDLNEDEDVEEKKEKNDNSKSIELKNKEKSKSKEEENEENEDNEDEEEGEEEEDYNDDNDDSKISNDSLFKKEIEQSKIRYIEKNLNKLSNNTNPGDIEYDIDEKAGKKVTLLNNDIINKKIKGPSFITIVNNFNKNFLALIKIKTLTEFKNKIYSNKGLEMITGLRTFCLILITLNICFNLFQESPAIRPIHYKFLQNFLFGSIKFSSFGFYFWIYLDGFVYTFKLMHFSKKEKSFKHFSKFLINLIPKIFAFIMIFYGVYKQQKDIGKVFDSSTLFEQYIENQFDYKCLNNPLYLIFPFINPITSDNNKMVNNYFNNCYEFSYVLINELYCIIILVIMFYFLYKYKSKVLDIIITVFVAMNILIMNLMPFFFEGLNDEDYYLLKYVMGETFSLRYPHSMFNIFFIGIFTGLIYYYHIYSVNDYNSYLNEEYFPFQFLPNLMKYFYKFNWAIKSLLILFGLGIIILDCSIFYIVESGGEDGQILYNFSGFLKTLYLYESPIVIFSISILLIFLLIAEDKFQIKAFLGSKIFYIMEKTSFCFVCLVQIISILFLSSSNFHGETWSFLYLYYVSFFIFAVGLFASFIFSLVFELPAKILANILRGKKTKEMN